MDSATARDGTVCAAGSEVGAKGHVGSSSPASSRPGYQRSTESSTSRPTAIRWKRNTWQFGWEIRPTTARSPFGSIPNA